MIPGHDYIGLVIPPDDRLLFAAGLVLCAAIAAYLFVKVILHPGKFHEIINGGNK